MTQPRPPAIFPPLLPPKGTIGIVAPSRWPRADMLDSATRHFEARGYEVVVHDQCYHHNGTLAGSDAERAEALNEMFADRTIDAIFCARGGSGAMLIVDRLDYEIIRANPKPIIGSSDITGLLQAITRQTGMVTYHGPVTFHFLPERYESATEEDAFYMISGESGERRLRFPMAEIERAGVAEGRLVGGNMCLLQALIGTPYDWSGEGAILFIEDVNEPLYRIERALAHMRLAGKFEGVRAVLVGEMIGILDEKPDLDPKEHTVYGTPFKDIVLKHIPPEIPLAFNVPCGHGRRLSTFPVGATVQMNMTDSLCEMVVRP